MCIQCAAYVNIWIDSESPALIYGWYIDGSADWLTDPPFLKNLSEAERVFFCAKRVSNIVVGPKEMLLSFSNVRFLTYYEVTNIKH